MQISSRLLAFIFSSTLLLLTYTNANEQKILRPTEAFLPQITAINDKQLTISINIVEGHYIYRERVLTVEAKDFNTNKITLSAGEIKSDQYFGDQSIWYGSNQVAQITIDYSNPNHLTQSEISLTLQGCMDKVICYPPETFDLAVNFPKSHTASNLLQESNPTRSIASHQSSSIPSSLLIDNSNEQALLAEDDAFSLYIENIDSTTFSLNWNVAENYYLYKNKIKINDGEALIANIAIADGQQHYDEFFGEQAVFRGQGQAKAIVYLKEPVSEQNLTVEYQGCADVGVCYPVMRRDVLIDTASGNHANNNQISQSSTTNLSVQDKITNILIQHKLLAIGILLLAGIALAFTPCVLPMVPILLGIITNQKQASKAQAGILSLAYVLGIAVMMAVFGLVVAKTGINIQIIFQKPLLLVLFASIFIVMGLAMFGVLNVALPSRTQSKIYQWQNKLQSANPAKLFLIGALSTLVVGPCVAPPLIAILAFISTTNDALLGALYLFVLGFGMGLPLIVFAVFSSHIPKTGELSKLISKLFAMLMLGVALWLLSRLLSGQINLLAWGLYSIGFAYLLFKTAFKANLAKLFTKTTAAALFILGMVWLTGAATGHGNLLKPFSTIVKPNFTYINNSDELKQAINKDNKLVMLDLYADWCISCQEIEHITFVDAEVMKAFSNMTLLKLDITDTNKAHRELLKQYNLIGPPALLFFKNGQEIKAQRIIGVVGKDKLLEAINHLSN